MYVNWNSEIPYIPPRYVYDCMISTVSGTNEFPTTSSGTDEPPTTSSGANESSTTSSGTDEFPTMTTGSDESPTTSRGPDESFIMNKCAISNNSMSMVELEQRCFLSCNEVCDSL